MSSSNMRPTSGDGRKRPAPNGARRPVDGGAPRRPAGNGAPRRPMDGDAPRRPAGNGAPRRPMEGEAPRRTASNGAARKPEAAPKKVSSSVSRKKSLRAKKKARNRIIIFAVEIAVIAILGVVLFWVFKFKKTGHQNNEGEIEFNKGVEERYEVVAPEGDGKELIGDLYTQVALFGVDSREGQIKANTRSDTIIIASINNNNHEVKLCSVFRDTYLNLSNDSYNKCNSAYAKGGPSQAINMLNLNLDMNIKDFITVGFKGVVETVDALGGVTIDISDAEIHFLNDYQFCISEDLGYGGKYTPVSSSGVQTLNGLQATAYCRIRYTAGDDFKRAERQRTVVTQMTEKAKNASLSELTTIATSAFNNAYTSFDLNEIIDLAGQASKFEIVASDGFPFEGYRTTGTIGSKGSCVIPTDLKTNVSLLHKFFFGIDNYEPTKEVQNCSDKIKADTSPYL